MNAARKNKVLLWILFTSSSLVALGFFLYPKKESVQYDSVVVERGDLRSTISTTGVVKPKNRLELKPPVAGRVEKLLVDEGMEVKKGQTVGWFSSSDRVALIDAARANGSTELKRWKEIYKATPLVAPIDGTVILRNAEPGQTLTLADAIITIADHLVVNAQVDETDVAKIKMNLNVDIILDAYPDAKIPGEVEHVAFESTVSDNVVVYQVSVIPKNAPNYMKSGMSAETIFYIENKSNILILPTSAIQYKGNDSFVYTKDDKAEMVEKTVSLGIQNEGKIEVISGLKEGDLVYVPIVNFEKGKTKSSKNPFLPQRPDRKKNSSGPK